MAEPGRRPGGRQMERRWDGMYGAYTVRHENSPITTKLFDVVRLADLLEDVWKGDRRQELALYISEWAAKAGVDPLDVFGLYALLAERRGDAELNKRIETIYYSYRKLYGDIPDLEALDRVVEKWRKRGRIEGSISKDLPAEQAEAMKRSGVQEILEEAVGEERALWIIKEITETFVKASPYQDAVIYITDFNRRVGYANNIRKKKICQVVAKNGRVSPMKQVWEGAIAELTVHVNSLTGVTRFEVTWVSAARAEPLRIGPATLEEIYNRLVAENFLLNPWLGRNALRAIVMAFIEFGKAKVKVEGARGP